MTERMLYRCDICGCEYLSKDECEECEKRHEDMMPVKLFKARNFPDFYPVNRPPIIFVGMKNGDVWAYSPLKPANEKDFERFVVQETGKKGESIS